MYKPLPKYLTIKESKIDGLGLFALQDIEKNTTIGVSHVKHDDYLHGLIRTPLGGFINHKKDSNCKLREVGQEMYLQTIKNIKKDEELTLTYSLYTI